MDGHEGQAQSSGFYFNGRLPSEADSLTRALDRGRWSRAEKRVAELIARIQPNQPSEIQRNGVESYMRRLITKCFPCQSVGPVDVALDKITADNFSRILGAFSDGARQLAKLLDCPEKNPIAEVDNFFQNTWDRYGKGSHPDTPSPEIDGSYSFRNNVSNTSFEVKENSTGSDSNAVVKCASHAPHGVPSQHDKQSLTQISRTGRSSRSNSLRNEEHDRNLYGRLHSNSELMDVSAEVPSRQRSNNSIRVTARFLTVLTEDRFGIAARFLTVPTEDRIGILQDFCQYFLVDDQRFSLWNFSTTDEASHVDEGPSSVHDSEFPSPD
ncbi:hypothetical protein Q3G72_025950 [Acer saccharum]|nr:hypothetical protein Q3G72_025950 [Acer saccharum]